MAGITFSEQEIKKLILALASSKTPEMDEAKETPEHEAKPEDKAEGETPDKEESAGKPFKKEDKPEEESTKAMLERKLKEGK